MTIQKRIEEIFVWVLVHESGYEEVLKVAKNLVEAELERGVVRDLFGSEYEIRLVKFSGGQVVEDFIGRRV